VANESTLNLQDIINILQKEASLSDDHRCLDWEEVDLEDGERTRRKDDFECWLRCQKISLYEIEAQEFLFFAKRDFEEESDRGRVNALTNAKRAIECRVDECLKLLNLNGFSSQHGWKLPYKIQVLQTFNISAPSILRRRITSKRNLLEHEYIRPRNQEEVQDIVEIAELFVKATDKYIEKGYISSATITCTTWFEDNGGQVGQLLPLYWGISDEYYLNFDYSNGTLTVTHLEKEIMQETRKNRVKKYPLGSPDKKEPVTIKILDCAMEDVRELMILLRDKGSVVR
jgi:hypothetical protein